MCVLSKDAWAVQALLSLRPGPVAQWIDQSPEVSCSYQYAIIARLAARCAQAHMCVLSKDAWAVQALLKGFLFNLVLCK